MNYQNCACPCDYVIEGPPAFICDFVGCYARIAYGCVAYDGPAKIEGGEIRCWEHQFVCPNCDVRQGSEERTESGECKVCAETTAEVRAADIARLGIKSIAEHVRDAEAECKVQ